MAANVLKVAGDDQVIYHGPTALIYTPDIESRQVYVCTSSLLFR